MDSCRHSGSHIAIVESVLLGLLHSSCDGNWMLHLNSIHALIPWCFACEKVNYSRYLSVIVLK